MTARNNTSFHLGQLLFIVSLAHGDAIWPGQALEILRSRANEHKWRLLHVSPLLLAGLSTFNVHKVRSARNAIFACKPALQYRGTLL